MFARHRQQNIRGCGKNSTPFSSFLYMKCYFQRIRLYSLIFITILTISYNKIFFPNQSQTFFFLKMYPSDICTNPTCVYQSRRLSQSDVCTSPTFVPVRRLYESDVFKSVDCTVRPLQLLTSLDLMCDCYPYDYTRFADGTPFEKEFQRSSFNFLNLVFTIPYQIKPTFYTYS